MRGRTENLLLSCYRAYSLIRRNHPMRLKRQNSTLVTGYRLQNGPNQPDPGNTLVYSNRKTIEMD